MIQIKYGTTTTQFGQFKFGSPIEFYIYDSIIRYLPKFIIKSEICNALIYAIAVVLTVWNNTLKKLLTIKTDGGYPTRLYANDDCQLFISNNQTDSNIQNAIKNRYIIHRARGKYSGIINDLQRISNNSLISIDYYNYYNCGWYLDNTYPGTTNGTNTLVDNPCCFQLDNMLDIKIRNNSQYTDKEFVQIIRKEFIPATINARITLIKNHTLKWDEVKSGFGIKFGIFKYGEIIK